MAMAMKPVELVMNFCGETASGCIPTERAYLRRGAASLLAARGVSNKYDAIIDLMESLRGFTVRLEIYAHQVFSANLGERLTDIIVALMEVFAYLEAGDQAWQIVELRNQHYSRKESNT